MSDSPLVSACDVNLLDVCSSLKSSEASRSTVTPTPPATQRPAKRRPQRHSCLASVAPAQWCALPKIPQLHFGHCAELAAVELAAGAPPHRKDLVPVHVCTRAAQSPNDVARRRAASACRAADPLPFALAQHLRAICDLSAQPGSQPGAWEERDPDAVFDMAVLSQGPTWKAVDGCGRPDPVQSFVRFAVTGPRRQLHRKIHRLQPSGLSCSSMKRYAKQLFGLSGFERRVARGVAR